MIHISRCKNLPSLGGYGGGKIAGGRTDGDGTGNGWIYDEDHMIGDGCGSGLADGDGDTFTPSSIDGSTDWASLLILAHNL